MSVARMYRMTLCYEKESERKMKMFSLKSLSSSIVCLRTKIVLFFVYPEVYFYLNKD